MTSKAVLSQIEVNERRLKGIYDQLESGSLKKAIAESDKVLKKNPNLLSARVLKGLALYRSGKTQESFSIVNEVIGFTPTDESTLSTLSYFLKESNQKNRIVDVYEEAYKLFPNREDICINLFNCHVKTFNYLSQQKVAVQLKKLNANHMEYGMWTMIGNVLHGVYNNDPRLIKLGEAMITKYFNSNAILSAERIEFLIFIFEKLGKTEECYNWLCGQTLKDVVENNQNDSLFNIFKVDLLLKMKRREEAVILQGEMVTQSLDNIRLWREYIDNAVELNMDKDNLNSLESIAKKLNDNDNNRIAIKVAKIHLSIALKKLSTDLSKNFGSTVEKIVDYFVRFGDRSSCFYDIYTFLCMDSFTQSERADILRQISEQNESLSITNNKEVERYFLMMTLKRSVEGSSGVDVASLVDNYHNALPLSDHFGVTEIKPCDNFLKLAVSCYFDRWLMNPNDADQLIKALSLLKQGIDKSPANYHLRLQLSHLYGLLRCQDLAIGQFSDLEIKQLMWDSLGHHYIVPALSVPSFDNRVSFLKRNIMRKQKNQLEIEENLVTCYKLGNYGRIPEMIDFHRAIDASVMSRLSEAEIIYINTVLKTNSCDDLFSACGSINLAQVESTDSDLDILDSLSYLKDFRDLNTSPDFRPIERCWTVEDQTKSFKHIVLWIAQRYLVLRAYYASAKMTMETVVKLDILSNDSTANFTEEKSKHYNVLTACRRDIVDMWSQMASTSGTYANLSDDLTGCPEPPSNIFSRFFPDLMTKCIDSITTFHDHFVRKLSTAGLSDWNQTVLSPMRNVLEQLLLLGEEKDMFTALPRLISLLAVACEMFAVITMNVTLIENMTKPMRPKLGVRRKNRKKQDATGDMGHGTGFDKFREFLEHTKFQSIPATLIAMIGDIDLLIARSKSAVDGLAVESGSSVPLVQVFDSWKTSLDDASQLLTTKKSQLEVIRKVMENEVLLECMAKVDDLKIEV